ncbi:hypothetical protein AMECASPLE_004351 [Ameca splendens]|uniref:Uncharacterized protein n=1 Tax=Ameca splendens TaxID=208324 RepID=A0ABV1A525_9TELE
MAVKLHMSQQRPWETPPRQLKSRKVCTDVSSGGRKMPALLPDQDTQPGEQAKNGAEPPHAPSAPAAVERAEPPDRPADVSLPSPSAAEPAIPGALLPTVHEVHVWQKHSVRINATEDPGMQASRQHDGR